MKDTATPITEYDYSDLRSRVIALGKTNAEVAAAGGMSGPTFSLKINNKGQFSQDQIILISVFLGIPFEQIPRYFFKRKVQLN